MTREELFSNLSAGARWDVGVSINRSNSLPLDAYSLFNSYEAATVYASKDADRIAAFNADNTKNGGVKLLNNAYIGQIIAVIEDKTVDEATVTTVGIYYIDANLALQPVGKEVVADNKTIVNDNGTIKLYGFETAATATYPRKKADGTLEWVTVQELVEGATENTITVGDGASIVNETTETGYKVSVNGYAAATAGQVPFKSATGFDWKDVYTKSEIDAKVSGVLSYKGVAAGAPTDNGANILVGDTTISASAANVGHVYAYEGREYVSNGLIWEELGDSTDLSAYYTAAQVDAAIDADVLVETNRATQAEEALSGRITTLENFDHSVYATNTRVEAVEGRTTTLEGSLSTLEGTVSTEAGKIATLQGQFTDLDTVVSGHTTVINGLDERFNAKLNESVYNEYVAVRTKTDEQIASDIATATDGLSTLKSEFATVKSTVGDENNGLVKDVAELKSKTQTNAADIVTLNTSVGTNTTDIATIKGQITSLDGRATTNETNIANLTKVLKGYDTEGSVDTAIKAAASAASAAQSTANDAIAGVNANAQSIANVNDKLTAYQDALTGTNGKVTVLESDMSTAKTDIERSKNDISALYGDLSILDGKVETEKGRIDTLEGQITGLTGAMHFRGIASQDPTIKVNEVQQGPAIEGIESYASGDVVIFSGKEYVYDGSVWHLFGDEGSYALKDSVYTKTDIDGKLENIETTHSAAIATAKSEAIAAAAEDATSKANAAAGQALIDAKAYVDAALTWQEMPELV